MERRNLTSPKGVRQPAERGQTNPTATTKTGPANTSHKFVTYQLERTFRAQFAIALPKPLFFSSLIPVFSDDGDDDDGDDDDSKKVLLNPINTEEL